MYKYDRPYNFKPKIAHFTPRQNNRLRATCRLPCTIWILYIVFLNRSSIIFFVLRLKLENWRYYTIFRNVLNMCIEHAANPSVLQSFLDEILGQSEAIKQKRTRRKDKLSLQCICACFPSNLLRMVSHFLAGWYKISLLSISFLSFFSFPCSSVFSVLTHNSFVSRDLNPQLFNLESYLQHTRQLLLQTLHNCKFVLLIFSQITLNHAWSGKR